MADFPIVGIGSSAGGLEALQRLFGACRRQRARLRRGRAPGPDAEEPPERAAGAGHQDAGRARRGDRSKSSPTTSTSLPPDQDLTIPATCSTRTSRRAPRGHRRPVDRSSAHSPKINGSARSRSCSRARAPTAPRAYASSRPKAASCWPRIRNRPTLPGMPQSAITTGVADLVLVPEKMAAALLGLPRSPIRAAPEATGADATLTVSSTRCWRCVRAATAGLPLLQERPCCAASTGAWACTQLNGLHRLHRAPAQRPGRDRGAGVGT